MNHFSVFKKISFLILILAGTIFLAIWKGSTSLKLVELLALENRSILYTRIARTILALLTGSGLAVCGVTLQAILKNPLAEPYLLGTSSGAGLGAVLAIFSGFSITLIPFTAFLGAILTVFIVYYLAEENGRIPMQSLILFGVVIAVAFSGLIVFLVSLSPNEALHGIMWWLLGSLEVYDWKLLYVVGGIVSAGIFSIFIFSQDLNAISLGEEEAVHLGIEIEKLKKILFLITSLITGALVSVSGIIGFVGLIVPHMMRYFVGPNHRVLIPASCIGAGAFLVLCDTISRTITPPVEIPIGVITSILGAPLFIALLKRGQKIK